MKLMDFSAGAVTGLAVAAVALFAAAEFGAISIGTDASAPAGVPGFNEQRAAAIASGGTARAAVPPVDGKRMAQIMERYKAVPPKVGE